MSDRGREEATTSFTVTLPSGDTVGAMAYPAAGAPPPGTTMILAHGAGAPQTHPFMTAFARLLSARGIEVVTFNFLYMERGRRVPDPKARLEACYRAVIAAARARAGGGDRRMVIGGKSMGRPHRDAGGGHAGPGRQRARGGPGRRRRGRPRAPRLPPPPPRPARQAAHRAPAGRHRPDAVRPGRARRLRHPRRAAPGPRHLRRRRAGHPGRRGPTRSRCAARARRGPGRSTRRSPGRSSAGWRDTGSWRRQLDEAAASGGHGRDASSLVNQEGG